MGKIRRKEEIMKEESKNYINLKLDYWKNYITMHHVLACELSYSLIYNNIRPEKTEEALATVGLTKLPNRFMLIQVDDYYNYSSQMQITQEFYQKTELINLLREYMKKAGMKGFVANLVGIDKISCFLCCEEEEKKNIRIYLSEIAERFKEEVRNHSEYTISICISRQCTRLWQYSQMQPKMEQALNESYFSGKEFSIFLEDVELKTPGKEADLTGFYPDLMVIFSRGNREKMELVLQSVMQVLLEGQANPEQAKMELLRLLQHISAYGIRCGIPEKQMKECSDRIMAKILACGFIADSRKYFMEFFDEFTRLLREINAGSEYLFRIPVSEYIETHYTEDIRLGHLAQMIGLSDGHFTRVFKEEFGMTFVQYLTQYRITQSKELLLTTSVPIEQIAYRVGINSYSYFCTCFKRLCGISPGEFRKQNPSDDHNIEMKYQNQE